MIHIFKMNTNYTYTEEQQQAILHLKKVGSDLHNEMREKLKEAEDILIKIRFNAVMRQINLEVPRKQASEIRPLTDDQQKIFDSLLSDFRTKLSREFKEYENSLPNEGFSGKILRQCENHCIDTRSKSIKQIKIIRCAWQVRMGKVVTNEDFLACAQHIQSEIEDRVKRVRIELKGFVITSRVFEIKHRVLAQLEREYYKFHLNKIVDQIDPAWRITE